MTLARWLIVRRLLRDRGRTLLTVAGVALGVAVFVAIRLASHSALASFRDTVDAVAGRANLQVTSLADGLDERIHARIRATPGVLAAAPIVQVSALARTGPGSGSAGAVESGESRGFDETVMVLGLDPLVEGPFLRLDSQEGRTAARDFEAVLRLLAEPATAAITRTLSERRGLRVDDTLWVLSAGVPVPLCVAAILGSEELQQAMGGLIVLTDIATAQDVFHRAGRLDRVDLIVEPARRDEVTASLAAWLPADARAALPQARSRQVENMVSAFSLNLTALSFIALFVSMFLVFNAVALSVVRQRRDLGVLRALGMTRTQALRHVLAEGAFVGLAGGVLGLGLGLLLARGTLGFVGRTLTDLYLIQHTGDVRLDPWTLAAGATLGLVTSLLSALAPAWEAASTRPGVTLRQGALIEAQSVPVTQLAAAGLGLLAAAWAVAQWTLAARAPWGGFAAAFLVIAGFTLMAPAVTRMVVPLASPLAMRLGGIMARLGVRALREVVARASVVVGALMLAVGMLVALTVMVGSFRRTVDTWITQTLRGDLYIEPVGHRASLGATALPDSLLAAAAALPGVAAIDTYRASPLTYGGRLASVVGIDFEVQAEHGRLEYLGGLAHDEVMRRCLEAGEVIVTESFAHRHQVRRGDTLQLPAPAGAARVRIAGVFFDYSTDAGAVLMDRRMFARLWRDDRTESLALYLVPGADAEQVRLGFLRLAGPGRLLHVTPNQALRERVLTVFDQTFQITWALQGIAVLVAALGVVSTLTTLVLQRAREIGVLRAVGATRAQIVRMVLTESGLLGLAGSLLGCAAGLVLAVLLVHVINKQYFGWSIRFTVDPNIFIQAALLMVVTALIAGLFPARLAAGRIAAEAVRVE